MHDEFTDEETQKLAQLLRRWCHVYLENPETLTVRMLLDDIEESSR